MTELSKDPLVAEAEVTAPVALGDRRKRWFGYFTVALGVIAAAWGVWYWLAEAGRVSTDNAYVGADTAIITPLVAGPVLEVRVANTQSVRKGDVLVRLDPADARIAVAEAESALAQAVQRYNQARAQVRAAAGQTGTRDAEIRQARARVADAAASFERARVELARRQALVSSGAVSGDELTAARTAFETTRAALELARAGVASAQAARQAAGGELGATEALVAGTTSASAPEIVAARARLARAKLDLDRTVIRAPIDGVVTNKQVQLGSRVAAGTPIMTLVPIGSAYVDANFKEDQLARVRPGQPVELTSDFYGDDVVFHGRVVGFSGGTGAAFALIPPQNATGNWIKVVQRLPVRIQLEPAELAKHPLRVGLSMDATVDTRQR